MGSVAYNPPEGKDYKWYIRGIFPANWGMDYATYHLLREPKTTIDDSFNPAETYVVNLDHFPNQNGEDQIISPRILVNIKKHVETNYHPVLDKPTCLNED